LFCTVEHMYQTIHEAIAVVGVYSHACFTPKKFLWKNRVHQIADITSVTDIRDGQVRARRYSCVAENNSYRLVFNRSEETWLLEEVWCE